MGSQNRYAFYIGMAPGDCLMGVVSYDRRLLRWLTSVGFQSTSPTENWELDLSTFRPPMDRGQLAIRRLASIGRILDDIQNDWWNAVVLGHTEQIRFHLSYRKHGTITEEVLFWHTDPAWSGISSSIARVWLPAIPSDGEPRDRIVYLLCEAFRQLQMERFAKIRAITSPADAASVSVLEKLSFRTVDQGMIYKKSL